MDKTLISKYRYAKAVDHNPVVFNEIPKNKISYEELEKASQKHTGEIIKIAQKLSETTQTVLRLQKKHNQTLKEQKSISQKLIFTQWELIFAQWDFIAMKRLFWVFLWAVGLVILWWIFEAHYRFGEVKDDYIRQTEQLQNLLSQQKRSEEKLKEDQDQLKKDNADLKAEIRYLRERIDGLLDKYR